MTDSACVAGSEPEPPQPEPPAREHPPQPVPADPEIRFGSHHVVASPDSSIVACPTFGDSEDTGGTSGVGVTFWDTAGGQVRSRLRDDLSGPIAWHPDGELLAIGNNAHVHVIDLDGTVHWYLTGHQHSDAPSPYFRSVRFSPDGSLLASLHADDSVRLWSVDREQCSPGPIGDLRPHEPTGLEFSPDGRTLAIGSRTGAAGLWDTSSLERRSTVDDLGNEHSIIGYATDGALVISARSPRAVHVLGNDGTSRTLDLSDHWPGAIAVHPEGRIALIADPGTEVTLWDPASDSRQNLPAAPFEIDQLLWSPDGSVLVAASAREGVMLWDGSEWITAEDH